MRRAFADSIINHVKCSSLYFITGDLGFMALEEVRDKLGARFINAGIAEQNMIGVAAGLAKTGPQVFVYSIAPFCYARPFEQIRNDICMSKLPVCIVGNGGGYGYGHMGPTHHALEDCAVMRSLSVRVCVPAFDKDISTIVRAINEPTYLRLGLESKPDNYNPPPYQAWRKLLDGNHGTLVALGPLSGIALFALKDLNLSSRPSVWSACELDEEQIPNEFWKEVDQSKLIVLEEHVREGGLGASLALMLLNRGIHVRRFMHRFALRYPNKTFGSQNFHRVECGLDLESIRDLALNEN